MHQFKELIIWQKSRLFCSDIIETQILIATDLDFIKIEESNKLCLQLNEIVKMISKFRSSLKMQDV